MWKIYSKDDSAPLEKTLKDFLTDNKIKLSNELDIISLANNLGFHVIMMPLEKQKLDGLILVENDEKVIAVNEKLDIKKARFVVAHELAHYITKLNELKKLNESGNKKQLFFAAKDKIYHDKLKSPVEHNMDYLAAAILVPKKQFINELKSNDVKIADFKGADESIIKKKISVDLLDYFADRYNVETEVIAKRIAEVSYYD